jgi:hypothetical protein
MIQIVGYMIAAYGVARLFQTSEVLDKGMKQVVGVLGIGALILLAVILTTQADTVGNLASNF